MEEGVKDTIVIMNFLHHDLLLFAEMLLQDVFLQCLHHTKSE